MTRVRALAAAVVMVLPGASQAAPVLTSGIIRSTFASPLMCEVTMSLRVDGAREVEHRIESFEGAEVRLGEVRGGRSLAEPHAVGRTLSLRIQLDQPDYELRYHVVQSSDRRERCPIWLPVVPTTGRLGAIRLEVTLPAETRPSSSMPALTWSGGTGTTTLSHIPAFVRVAYNSEGEAAGWDVLQVMDGIAIAVFLAASGIWVWRRRR